MFNLNTKFLKFSIEERFNKSLHFFNKYTNASIVKESFGNGRQRNEHAVNFTTEFDKIQRIYVLKKNESQAKNYKKAFLTFLNSVFSNFLFLNKNLSWIFFFYREIGKKKVSDKVLLNYFFSILIKKNIDMTFSDTISKLYNSYKDFYKKFTYNYFFLAKRRITNANNYNRTKNYSKKRYKGNFRKKKFVQFLKNSYKINEINNKICLTLFYLRKRKKFKFNSYNLKKTNVVKYFFDGSRKRYRRREYNYIVRKKWFIKKFIIRQQYFRKNFVVFYKESPYNIIEQHLRLKMPLNKNQVSSLAFFKKKLFFKFKLVSFFKQVKSNLPAWLNIVNKHNSVIFYHQEKEFLSSLEHYNYRLFLDYFYFRNIA